MVAAPGAGVLGERVEAMQTKLLPIENNTVRFNRLELPVDPMIGVIGVAPAGDPVNCGTPGYHGGNMDTRTIRAGSSVYFPVQVEGGLLAMGDLHAAMGDGEIMVSGVEVSGEVDVTVSKASGLDLSMPMVKSADRLAMVASEETADLALSKAVNAMADFLTVQTDLDLNQAGMLMSACGHARISQIVDPAKTARFFHAAGHPAQAGCGGGFLTFENHSIPQSCWASLDSAQPSTVTA